MGGRVIQGTRVPLFQEPSFLETHFGHHYRVGLSLFLHFLSSDVP